MTESLIHSWGLTPPGMPYLRKKSIRGRTYHYVVTSVRLGGKVRKFQVYAGDRRPTTRVRSRLETALERKVRRETARLDPLVGLLTREQEETAAWARRSFDRLVKSDLDSANSYREWFITTFTYDSNAIEGSTLTPEETALVLFEGLSPAGRPLRDVRAAENHRRAYEWMLRLPGGLTRPLVLGLHRRMSEDLLPPSRSGRLRPVQVYVRGSPHMPPPPEAVPVHLAALLRWARTAREKYHPVVLAARFHVEFERIHPFVDYNGRTGRLLINFMLLRGGLPPIDIRNKERLRYYEAIRIGIEGDLRPMASLIIDRLGEFAPGYSRRIGKR